ncbi:MAG: crossover junction endodeoxyribonuclease RuvC [Chloroflexota bacterium]
MRILGVDPGTAACGYGVVAKADGHFVALEYGLITTPSSHATSERLRTIYREILDIIGRWHPDRVAVEEVFFARNAKTAMAVGQARGVVMLAAALAGVPVVEYTPLEVKKSVTTYGRGPKEQVGQMVAIILGLPEVPRPDDVADALAVALCDAFRAEARLGAAP